MRNELCRGKRLIALAVAVSTMLSDRFCAEDLALLGTFFTVLGDQLALLSIFGFEEILESSTPEEASENTSDEASESNGEDASGAGS